MASHAGRRIRAAGAAATLLVALLAPSGTPQMTAAAQQKQEKPVEVQQPYKVQVNVVNLFVTVRDKHNAIIGDLTKDDFRVFEDGAEQKVEFFSKELNLPLTMGLLVDTSGSMERLLGAEQETATRFLTRVMRKGDLAMLITFDIDADLLTDFTGSVSEIERGLSRARINAPVMPVTPGTIPSHPRGTVLYDAVYLAATDKLASEVGRKAIILLTDAEDEGSRKRLDDAIEAAQRADTVIHVLRLSDPGFYGFGTGGGSVAKKMAEETGGREIEVKSEKNLEQGFDQLTDELRSQYTLGYYPSNTAHDGRFRKLKVEVKRSGLKVLVRRGYYAPRN